MKNDLPAQPQKSTRARRSQAALPPTSPGSEPQIHVARSGDWMPADELREAALSAMSQENDVILDLDHIDHLDASALQILVALDSDLKKCDRNLRLEKASAQLLKWFEFAGADDRFFHDRTGQR